jgi:small-conductance mechanosensitive channel
MEWLTDILEYKIFDISGRSLTVFNLLLIVFIYIIVRVITKALSLLFLKRIAPKYQIDEGKAFSMLQLVKYFMYVIAFALALESLGINISLLLAGSAALLVGLGLGIQEIFKDLVSGLILLFEGSLKVGDVIEVDQLVGVVKEINIRTSKVRTRDGIIIIVPNSNFINEKVINWSNSSKLTRFHIKVGVAYGSDVNLVREILIQCAATDQHISQRPKPFVRFTDFADSSLEFQLYFWTERVWTIENTKSDLRFAIDEQFRQKGVVIPFPQRDLHIKGGNSPIH